ncbi:cytochrome ubiquinol oxidase subunit I [Mesorhizobium sp. M1066]|uniref:hypothetical protein n=1 Tax=unclassified Mesorhizobium TaxID=325217 RepID=UPI00333B273D
MVRQAADEVAAIKRHWHHEQSALEMLAAWRDADNELNAITIPYLRIGSRM